MKFLVFVLIATLSSNTFAWGEKEQGVLIGIGGTLLIEELMRIRKATSENSGYPPFECKADEIECAYRLGVYERERREYEERKRKAYECGRYGTNCE
jgi:hypothetical protein